jgi:phosphoenolpyruvate carboxykinase (ATP)
MIKNDVGLKNPNANLSAMGISGYSTAYWNLSSTELVEHSILKKMGHLTNTGALAIHTGKFTGRTPKDRFIVKDAKTAQTVDWGNVNLPYDETKYDALEKKLKNYFKEKELYVRDVYACADPNYKLNIRVVTEYPWSSQFANNMFLRPKKAEIETFEPQWTIVNAPGFEADVTIDGTNRENFAIINFTKKQIIIGGTGYTGEIKKGIFSVLNYVLPLERKVLSMHCSANVGKKGDTAIFFGLSGTGKTTLSADPERALIGDDEHGWSDEGVFNFEGGCYAKTINLTLEKEPQIYAAIRHGAILENIAFYENSREVDYENKEITENTRVSYPIYHIDNALEQSVGQHPDNVFFLTCDAFGVLPPISKLTPGQAMYHFISGYTAKVPGTEDGVAEPETTFSACFGAPFMPLHPTKYAEMLGEKMEQYQANVWLVNTGWIGGEYGEGGRIKLRYTRAMISAALEGKLENATFVKHEIFGLMMPTSCPNVPDEILNPMSLWANTDAYLEKANELAAAFNKNFEKFAAKANEDILAAAPQVLVFG